MRKTRRGGTLIELLVALVLLDLALLSLASVAAVSARRMGEAGRRSRAAQAAANRVERLAGLSCSSMSGGSAELEPGVTETWAIQHLPGAVELSDSIEIRSRTPDRVVVRTRVPCG